MLFDPHPIHEALEPLLTYTPIDITSVILTKPFDRHWRTGALRSRLQNLRETCDALDVLQRKISSIRRAMRAREAEVANALAPVMGLPAEILQRIFLLVVYGQRGPLEIRNTHRHRDISQVCQSWKNAIVGLSELWSVVALPFQHAELFSSLAGRSRADELHLTVSHRPEQIADLILDAKDANRLTSVSLVGGRPGWARFLKVQPDSSLDLLRLDKVSITQESHGLHEHVAEWMVSSRHLALYGAGLQNPDGWSLDRLTELSISSVSGSFVHETLRAMNNHCPVLEQLTLRYITGNEGGVDLVPQPLGQGIKYLRLQKCHSDGWAPFGGESIPNLETMSVELQDGTGNCEFKTRIWVDILINCRKLETLDVSANDWYLPGIFDYLGRTPRGFAHPSLSSLRLHIYSWTIWDTDSDEFKSHVREYLRQKISERQANPSEVLPLRRLCVNKELVSGHEAWYRSVVGTVEIL